MHVAVGACMCAAVHVAADGVRVQVITVFFLRMHIHPRAVRGSFDSFDFALSVAANAHAHRVAYDNDMSPAALMSSNSMSHGGNS